MARSLLKLLALVGCLVPLLAFVGAQSVTCPSEGEDTTPLRNVILRTLLDLTTRYWGATAIGDDGFPLVDASLQYSLFDLFEQRYGSGTSTAPFLAGYLDILSATTAGATTAQRHLAAVIGLAKLEEYDAARQETLLLILTTLHESELISNTTDLNALTPSEVTIVVSLIEPQLITIQNSLTQQQFERYLNLAVGITLALVMDTTGSMASEIAAAQARIVNIIETTRGTVNQPLLYVLSPFNDPGVGPLTVTDDPDVIIPAVNALTASGGGDEPELALSGIYAALEVSTKRSVLFQITDATAGDPHLESRVIALALIRKIRIINLLTNSLPSAAGFPLYSRISRATGGLTTVTQRSDITSITELFLTLTEQGQVILHISALSTDPTLEVAIDQSLNDLSIQVSGPVGAVTSVAITSTRADGSSVTVTPLQVINANGLILLKIEDVSSFRGSLSLQFTGTLSLGYSIQVAASSVFGTIPHLLEEVDGVFQNVMQHRAGRNAVLEANLFGDSETTTATSVQLIAESGTVLVESPLSRCGFSDFYRSEEFVTPSERFYIKIIGTDADGNGWERTDACALTPLITDISLSNIIDVVITAGTSATASTTLSNNAAADTFTFDVSDISEYAGSFSPSSVSVATGGEQEVTITITVPAAAADGSVSRVTVTATPAGSDEFLFTTFNVIVDNPTTLKCPPLVSETGGNVLCSDGFLDGSTCTLTCLPGYVFDGETESTCEGDTWTVSRLGCRFVGTKTCQATGDPHYLTFDGRYYDFMGTCIYNLVSTTFNTTVGALEPFTIEVENEHRGGITRVSWYKQLFVKVYGQTINFRKGRIVTVDGVRVALPYSIASNGLSIQLTGSNVVLTTRFGLEVRYNGNANLFITLSASYADLVNGLCGNINGDPGDDLRLATNASVLANPNDFGNSYKVGGLGLRCQDGSDDDGVSDCDNQEEYASLCNIVETECFIACREDFPTPNIIQNCVFDLCVTGGELIALEQALDDYAQKCQAAGIAICDWRNETGTTPDCPLNSHYEHEGTACPNTCRRPNNAARCVQPPISGCVCNDGFVLSGADCVPQTECGCTDSGQYYLAGASFYRPGCTEFCSCTDAILQCTDSLCASGESCRVSPLTEALACVPDSFAQCTAYGDPHYNTFDGVNFDFQGACHYVLAHHDVTGGFRIITENEFRNGNLAVSWVRSVTIEFQHPSAAAWVSVVLSAPGGQIQSEVVGLFPNNTNAQVSDHTDATFQIQRSASSIIVRLPGDVTVTYRYFSVSVTIPSTLRNQLSGLCGNFNGDASDDFTTSNGTLTSDVNVFGTSFQHGECPYDDPPRPIDEPCTEAQIAEWGGIQYCGTINGEGGVFEECSLAIDLSAEFQSCLYDLCLTGGSISVLDGHLSAVAERCNSDPDTPLTECDWREATSLEVPTCPENSHYEGCTTACPATCLNPFAPEACSLPDTEGCACDLGYVLNNGKCMRGTECGCFTESFGYVQPGFSSTNSDCSVRYTCAGPRRWEREEIACAETELCLAVGDSFRCAVPDGHCFISGGHVSQYDGIQFQSEDWAAYRAVVSTGTENSPPFTVAVQNGVYHPVTQIKTQKVYVTFTRHTGDVVNVVIEPGVNQDRITIDGEVAVPGASFRGVSVWQQGRFATVRFAWGLVIRVNEQEGVVISLDGQLFASVDGLCGTFDNDPSNDVQVTDPDRNEGRPSLEIHLDTWRIENPDGTPTTPPSDGTDGCDKTRFRDYLSGRCGCGYLLLEDTALSACHDLVDVTPHYQHCLTATECHNQGNYLASLEAALIGYATECTIRVGITAIFNFRDVIGIGATTCPANSHYVREVAPCVATCGDRDGSRCRTIRQLAQFPAVEGCECDEGFIRSGFSCVPEDRCGCVAPDGLFFQHGDCQTNDDCTGKCQCRNGEWSCEATRCYSSQHCGVVDGHTACRYNDDCRYNNGGCSHQCRYLNGTSTCRCPSGFSLGVDLKTCVAVAPPSSTRPSCEADLEEWRTSYLSWRESYEAWETRFGECVNTGTCTGSSTAPTWELDGEVLGAEGCEAARGRCVVYWTRWFNSDTPDGCGDEETLDRLRDAYGSDVCNSTIAIETRIDSPATCDSGVAAEIAIRTSSHEEGFFCDNADQPSGVTCPDYAVRFLCLR